MTYGTDYPAPRPSPQDPPVRGVRGWSSLRWLPLIIVLANAVYAVIVMLQSLAGSTRGATGDTALYGAVLLVLVLLPSNLLRFRWFSRRKLVRFFAKLRKPLGISAGIWFVVHTIVGLVEYFDISGSLLRQLLIGDMAIGLIALLVFAALLATSSDASQRLLGSNWKWLHRLVWFAVPLALIHTALSSARLHHLEPPGILLFGGMIAFAAVEYFALRRRRGVWGGVGTHAGLVVAGTAVAVLIYAASWGVFGPWEITNDRPPGSPPGAEKTPSAEMR